jgi:RNA polymerase sigma-70 factor (ECF subfamily)
MYSADEQLVSQTLAGDRDAFGVLVHKYQDMVFAYAFQKVRNEADAQDVTQEVFLRAYRNLYSLRHPHRFRSWLYTIMSNECNRWLARAAKTRQREMMLADAENDKHSADFTHAVTTDTWAEDVEQAISALPDENRVAISMFYMGDCSLKEIAEFLGVSVNTVRGKLHRARRQLGSALSEHYGNLLKSRKLTGGFLMQMMEQFRRVPAPAMGFAWSSASVGKTVFSLITALCILIGLIGVRNDSPTSLPTGQIGLTQSVTNRMPMKVTLFEPLDFSSRWSISGVPVPTGKRPLAASNRASTEQGHNATNGAPMPHGRSVENPNAQSPAAIVENGAEKLTYSGRVVNDESEPVEGAEILYAVNWGGTKLGTRTEADGTFHFELTRPELGKWAEKRLDIVVTHSDYASRWRKLPLENTLDVRIQLDAPGTISGRIMNEAGEPIQNAEVTIQLTVGGSGLTPRIGDYDDYSMLNIFHHTPPAKTDENGDFIFHRLPPKATTVLYVQGPGYVKTKHIFVPVGRQGLEYRLKREARIEGRLSYAETGEPVVNAKVDLRNADSYDGSWGAHVDENGDFVVKNLGAGTYNLFLDFIDKGPDGWTAAARLGIEVSEEQTVSNMDLTLIRCGLITGRLIDKDTDESLSNIIYFHDATRPESQSSQHSTNPDESGVYRFHAAPGRVLVMTRAPLGYQDIGEVRRYVDVAEGESVTVDFKFSKGMELVVRTLTEAGDPVPDAWVSEELAMNNRLGGRSNESGEYIIRGPRPGQRLRLTADQRELGLSGATEVEVEPGESIQIQMEQLGKVKVSGRVVDEKGEPMPSVQISISRWSRQRKFLVATNVGVTGSDGRFQAVGLVEGEEYIIHANAASEEYYGAPSGPFTATAEMDDLADLVVKKLPPDLAAKQRAQNAYMNDIMKRSRTLTGQPAPELEVEEWLTGTPVSIRGLKGKTIALYFWEPAHLNYRQWVDLLNSLHQTYHEKGLVCAAVCAATAKVEKVKQHIAEQPLDYSVGLDRATDVVGALGKTFDRYAVWPSNSVVLINSEGEIAGIVDAVHAINEDVFQVDLENRIKALLGN